MSTLPSSLASPTARLASALVQRILVTVSLTASCILENVKGIFSSSKRTVWKKLMEDLRAIGDGCYMVQSKVLNTRDHGLPQNRERVYVVLQHRFKTKVIAFKWPEPIPCPPLEHFLDGPKPELEHLEGPASKHAKKAWEANLAKLRGKGIEPEKHTFLFDTASLPSLP